MKFKELLKKISDIPKDLFKRFPYSISLSILASLFLAIFLESSFIEDVVVFLLLFPLEIIFCEIFFKDKKYLKIGGFILSIIIAILLNKYVVEDNLLIKKITGIYSISLIIIGVIKLIKDSKLSIGDYLARVFSNLFKMHLAYMVLSTGLLSISLIILTLFLNNTGEMIIVRLEILLGGIYYIPATLYSIYNTESKPWDFISFIIKNITSVILLIAFLIIYIYMLKIFITWNIPSNHIFRILSILFILGLPLWTMVSAYEKDNILVKISSKLPIAFIPFIILQIYSLVVRISANGYTVLRYIGIMLIVLEIIYSVVYLIDKEKIYLLGYVIILMMIIGILAPKINAVDLSINDQYYRMTSILNKKNITKKDQKNLASAYYYLNDYDSGRSLLKGLTKEQEELILQNDYPEPKCYTSNGTFENIDISEYNKISYFELSDYDIGKNLKKVNIKDYNLDLETLISKMEEDSDNKKVNVIDKGNYKIYLTDVDICLDNDKLDYYSINGYILEK